MTRRQVGAKNRRARVERVVRGRVVWPHRAVPYAHRGSARGVLGPSVVRWTRSRAWEVGTGIDGNDELIKVTAGGVILPRVWVVPRSKKILHFRRPPPSQNQLVSLQRKRKPLPALFCFEGFARDPG